jgi:hypothetical protein
MVLPSKELAPHVQSEHVLGRHSMAPMQFLYLPLMVRSATMQSSLLQLAHEHMEQIAYTRMRGILRAVAGWRPDKLTHNP